MALAQQTLIATYTANGSTTTFPFAFKIFADNQVSVVVNGLIQTTGFTLVYDSITVGGSVVFNDAPVAGTSIRIFRSTPLVRTTDFVKASTLDSDVLDQDLDYLTAICQENSSYGITLDDAGTWNANSFEMKNVGYPYGSNSAIPRSYLDSTLINTGNIPSFTVSDNNKHLRIVANTPTWQTLNIVTELGYTPLNKAGDTVTGNLTVSGTTTLNGTNVLSASTTLASNPATGTRSTAVATMQKFTDEFGSSIAANGYQKLPTGLIIQWGNANFTTTGSSNSFPLTFPNNVFSIAYGLNGASTSVILTTTASSTSSFTTKSNTGTGTVYYVAIGN